MKFLFNGFGLNVIAQAIFIAYKILGFIDWSWWVVLIPLWLFIGVFFVMFVCEIFKERGNR